jgi:L-fucose isomerase-like protein
LERKSFLPAAGGDLVARQVVLVPLASKLHGEEYYRGLLEFLLERIGGGLGVAEVVTTPEEAAEAGRRYAGDLPLLLFLTGGTSGLAREFVAAGGFGSVAMLAHGEHNSLASAVSARYKLEARGVGVWLSHCYSPWDPGCAEKARRLAAVARTAARLHGVRVAVVSRREPESAAPLREKLGAEVRVIAPGELERLAESAGAELAKAFAREVSATLGVEGARLEEVGRVYAALKGIFQQGFDAVALDCFDYLVEHRVTPCLALAKLNAEGLVTACEADLQALTLMLISKELTGVTGWIANATAFKGSTGFFSHCTVALNMISRGRVMAHFESGYPYALAGELAHEVYTIASLAPDFSLLAADVARVVSSGNLVASACRTQALVELGPAAEDVPRLAPANHHVFMPGVLVEELEALAALLKLDYLQY